MNNKEKTLKTLSRIMNEEQLLAVAVRIGLLNSMSFVEMVELVEGFYKSAK